MQKPLNKRVSFAQQAPDTMAVPIPKEKNTVKTMNNYCLLDPEFNHNKVKNPTELINEYHTLVNRLRVVRTELNGFNINPDEL